MQEGLQYFLQPEKARRSLPFEAKTLCLHALQEGLSL
jgi:hypothetical protein